MMRPEIGPTTFTKTWQVHSLNRTSHSQLYAARARFVSLSAPCRVRQLGVPFRNSHKTQVVVAGGEGRLSTNERVSGVIGTSGTTATVQVLLLQTYDDDVARGMMKVQWNSNDWDG